jgi:hypothetical protein
MFYTLPPSLLRHVHSRINQTLLDPEALLQGVCAGFSLCMTCYVYGFCMILIKGIQCSKVINFLSILILTCVF